VELTRDPGTLFLANRFETRRERSQLLARLCDLGGGEVPIRDIALDTEMAGDTTLLIVDAEIVTFDPDRRSIHPPLVGLGMDVPRVEHRAPSRLSGVDVVREELRRRFPDELRQRDAILASVGFIDDRHSLVMKHVLEQRVFVDVIVPLDGLIDHHDEEPVDRLREEQLAQAIRRK